MEPITPISAETEDQLRARIEELEALLAEAGDRHGAVEHEFESVVAALAHDLRSPLRGMAGYARALAADYSAALDAEGLRMARQIWEEAERANELIGNLRAFVRIGRQELQLSDIDMTELARSAFEILTEASARTAVIPSLELSALPVATGDRTLVRIILSQLLSNAVKFTAGRPLPLIAVSGSRGREGNVYCIADNGAGFESRYAHRLFGLFQRLHRPEDYPGAGIGLALVRRLVHRHGGRTWAEGELARGAQFYFSLPIAGGSPR